MNAHQLDANGVIINTVVVDSLDTFPGLIDASIGGSAGDSVINGALVKAARTAPVPQEVTRRQGLQALYLNGVTEAMIEAEIGKMLPPNNTLSLIEFRASQVFERQRPLVIQMGAVFALDLDAIFIQAAGLD